MKIVVFENEEIYSVQNFVQNNKFLKQFFLIKRTALVIYSWLNQIFGPFRC